jgi:hypothetical protein
LRIHDLRDLNGMFSLTHIETVCSLPYRCSTRWPISLSGCRSPTSRSSRCLSRYPAPSRNHTSP